MLHWLPGTLSRSLNVAFDRIRMIAISRASIVDLSRILVAAISRIYIVIVSWTSIATETRILIVVWTLIIGRIRSSQAGVTF